MKLVKLLSKFLLIWAAMDGSVLRTVFNVIVPDNEEMIDFFKEIITKLHEGVPFPLNEQHAKFDTPQGKDISHLRVSSPYKLCSVLENVLDNGKGVPPKKTHWVRRHAATWRSRRQQQLLSRISFSIS